MRSALILGGGQWQLGIISAARAVGLNTIVTDISPSAPGRELANVFVAIDTNDTAGLLAIAREHRPALVLAEQTDRLVPVAAFLNEQLGLPGIRPETAARFTNKATMRDSLVGRVPLPRYARVRDSATAIDRAAGWGFPLIVKPPAAQSSMGVTFVRSASELPAAILEAQRVAGATEVLVEEFIDGTEITVEGICLRGTFHVLAISEKTHYDFSPCVARRLAYPPRFDAAVIARIRDVATTVVTSLGLDTAISHAEYRVRDGVPYLVEVAARGGGNGIASLIVPHVSGLPLYERLIRTLLGEDIPPFDVLHRSALLEFFSFGAGRVRNVHGADVVGREKLAAVLSLPASAGGEIGRTTDDRNRPGFFIVLGDTRDDVDARGERIKQLIRVEYEGSHTLEGTT